MFGRQSSEPTFWILNLLTQIEKSEATENVDQFALKYAFIGVVVSGPDLQIKDVNRHACSLFGMSREQLLASSAQKPATSFILEDLSPLPIHLHPASRARELLFPVRKQILGFSRKGSADVIWVEVSAFPELDENHQLLQVVTIYTDVTLQRKAGFEAGRRAINGDRDQEMKERRNAELALQMSQSKLQAALESMNDAVFISDAQGNFVDFNEAFATFHKFKSKSDCATNLAAYPNLLEVSFPGGDPLPLENWAVPRALRGEKQSNVEYVLKRKDTGETWIGSYSFSPIRDHNGTITGSVVVGRDITAGKQAETALRVSEERLSKMFHSSPVAKMIATVDEGRIVDINQAFCRLIGYSSSEMIGRTTRELSLWKNLEDREHLYRMLVEGRPVQDVEIDFRRQTGDVRTVLMSIATVTIDGVAFGLSTVLDITGRKKAEWALRESEERFSRWFHASPSCQLISTFVEGRFVDVNAAFCRMIGYSREELVGITSAQINLFVDPNARKNLMEQLAMNGSLRDVRTQFRTKSGNVRDLLISVEPIEFKKEPHIITTVLDITEYLQAEAAKQKLQEQLLQSQKMETIGRLAGGIAHDFNNLLMVQMGYCELMRHQLRKDDPLSDGLSEIESCTERAAALTHQLLAFSRKQPMKLQVVDLNLLVSNLHSMLRRLIGEDIQLVMNPAPFPANVNVDPGKIEQVVVNLVVNARDAMPHGGSLTIQISEFEMDDVYIANHLDAAPGRYIELAVIDTGCGMDHETKRHIFEPFFTTKEEGIGTGLGLATVHGIVNQSGGSINVYSEVNNGTTFKVYLPYAKGEAEKNIKTIPEIVAADGELVMVVEDDAALRQLTERLISKLGYRVTMAESAEAALKLIEIDGIVPDVLIADVVMPRMSGPHLVDRIRKTLPELSVIYMSGYSGDAIDHFGIREPKMNFIQKPFSITTLSQTIHFALNKSNSLS